MALHARVFFRESSNMTLREGVEPTAPCIFGVEDVMEGGRGRAYCTIFLEGVEPTAPGALSNEWALALALALPPCHVVVQHHLHVLRGLNFRPLRVVTGVSLGIHIDYFSVSLILEQKASLAVSYNLEVWCGV